MVMDDIIVARLKITTIMCAPIGSSMGQPPIRSPEVLNFPTYPTKLLFSKTMILSLSELHFR